MCLSGSIWCISYICTYIHVYMYGSPHSKFHNLNITTGRVSHKLLSLPFFPQSFVLMSFSHVIQTSSCLKPPDPFMLCLCHSKQQSSDSGGGARFGPRIFLMGSLQANKQFCFVCFFHRGSLVFLCSRGHEESVGTGPAPFQGDSACEALEMELQYITRMAQIA